jgi:hypothetical protein
MASAIDVVTFRHMLHEIQAEALSYDPGTDTARLRAPGAKGRGSLGLFDAKGFLVGVDLRGDDPRASIVMLGPHEAVSETREIAARIEGDEVVIPDARRAVKGGEKNPYV